MTETTNTGQHWLQKTPTQFLQQYVQGEWQASGSRNQLRKIRYYSFTIRAFVFRGDKLFLTNRSSSSGLTQELAVPTDRLDITSFSQDDEEPPMCQVTQPQQRSIGDHIRTVLSSRYQHPNILQNARFLDEFSSAGPPVRRRIEAKTWGEEEIYLCDIELSIIMSKYDGALGNGPAFRWITFQEAASLDDNGNELHFVAGLDAAHVQDMFARFRTCRENQAFHDHCTETIRSTLRARWSSNAVDRAHRFGVVAQSQHRAESVEKRAVFLFTMTSNATARWKDSSSFVHDSVQYRIVGRFALEAVQLKAETETWLPAVDEEGKLTVQWCDEMARASPPPKLPFLVLT